MRNATRARTRSHGLVVALVLAITAVWASPAFGHSDEGEMKITKATATSPTTIELEAGITFANDNDLAEEAVVTATATDQAGASVGPIAMPRRTGALYAATIEVPGPGVWTIAVSSTEPVASASTQVDTTTPTTTSSSSSSTTTSTPSTTADTSAASPASSTPESTGTSTATLLGIAIVVALAIGAGVAVWTMSARSRRDRP